MTIILAERPRTAPARPASRRKAAVAVTARRRPPIAAGEPGAAVAAEVMAVLAAFGIED